MENNCLRLIEKSNRPDLWAKYLFAVEYVQYGFVSELTKQTYFETIKYVNGFFEERPRKRNKEEFLNHFIELIDSIKANGYDSTQGRPLQITVDNRIIDGAHRLAACAAMGINIPFNNVEPEQLQDYSFSKLEQLGLSESITFHLLRQILIGQNDYRILLIFPIVDNSNTLESLLLDFQDDIIFRKDLVINLNLLLVVNYLSYVIGDGLEETPTWVGSKRNPFSALNQHAYLSHGDHPLRIIIVRSHETSLIIKREIRKLIGIGNYSCHTSDSQFETLLLCEQIFDETSRSFAMNCGLGAPIEVLITLTFLLRKFRLQRLTGEYIFVVGSTLLSILGLRDINDIDVFYDFPVESFNSEKDSSRLSVNCVSNENSVVTRKILNHYGWYNFLGLQIISLDGLAQLKRERYEVPKDIEDLETIDRYRLDSTANHLHTTRTPKKSTIKRRTLWRVIRIRELIRFNLLDKPKLFRLARMAYRLFLIKWLR